MPGARPLLSRPGFPPAPGPGLLRAGRVAKFNSRNFSAAEIYSALGFIAPPVKDRTASEGILGGRNIQSACASGCADGRAVIAPSRGLLFGPAVAEEPGGVLTPPPARLGGEGPPRKTKVARGGEDEEVRI